MNVENPTIIWPLLLYAILAILLVSSMLGISYFLGQKHNERATGDVYEAGIAPTESARLRFPIQYYIVAMFFVIFDLEAAFIFAWAVGLKELGWTGYIGASIFIFILFAVLFYEWRIGALDFVPNGKKILKAYKARKKINSI